MKVLLLLILMLACGVFSQTITTQPKPDTVVTGDTGMIWVSSNGTTYQWYKIGTGSLSGKTNDTLLFVNTQVADTGRYYCLIDGTLSTDTVRLTAWYFEPDSMFTLLRSIETYNGDSIETGSQISGYWDSVPSYGAKFSAHTKENCDWVTISVQFDYVCQNETGYIFDHIDWPYQRAIRQGKKIRFTTLFFGQNTQYPVWFTALSNTEKQAVAGAYIDTVLHRYPLLQSVDVLNEFTSHTSGKGYDTANVMIKAIPKFWMWAFNRARAANPNVKLCVNDWGNERYDDLYGRGRAFRQFLDTIVADGAPFDEIGFHCHIQSDTGGVYAFHSIRKQVEAIENSTGIRPFISELDVRIPDVVGDSAVNLQKSGQMFANVIRTAIDVGISRIIMWGFWDQDSWIPEAYQGWNWACIYGAYSAGLGYWNKKQAYLGILSMLKQYREIAPQTMTIDFEVNHTAVADTADSNLFMLNFKEHFSSTNYNRLWKLANSAGTSIRLYDSAGNQIKRVVSEFNKIKKTGKMWYTAPRSPNVAKKYQLRFGDSTTVQANDSTAISDAGAIVVPDFSDTNYNRFNLSRKVRFDSLGNRAMIKIDTCKLGTYLQNTGTAYFYNKSNDEDLRQDTGSISLVWYSDSAVTATKYVTSLGITGLTYRTDILQTTTTYNNNIQLQTVINNTSAQYSPYGVSVHDSDWHYLNFNWTNEKVSNRWDGRPLRETTTNANLAMVGTMRMSLFSRLDRTSPWQGKMCYLVLWDKPRSGADNSTELNMVMNNKDFFRVGEIDTTISATITSVDLRDVGLGLNGTFFPASGWTVVISGDTATVHSQSGSLLEVSPLVPLQQNREYELILSNGTTNITYQLKIRKGGSIYMPLNVGISTGL